MDETSLRAILEDVRSGALSPDEAASRLRRLPFADLAFAKVDHHRVLRQGLPEAVYGPGKTPEQCAAIVTELLAEPGGGPVLLTRAGPEQAAAALGANPGATVTLPDGTRASGPTVGTRASGKPVGLGSREEGGAAATRSGGTEKTPEDAGTASGPLTLAWRTAPTRAARSFVVTAGTADLPVASECIATQEALGIRAQLLADCGVAGVHRLLASDEELRDADVIVVVAGMEGALASVVGGVYGAPVVAVPTSVGYGSAFEGITALLAMHASCAAGVTVVGIDNGFGAACAVARIMS